MELALVKPLATVTVLVLVKRQPTEQTVQAEGPARGASERAADTTSVSVRTAGGGGEKDV